MNNLENLSACELKELLAQKQKEEKTEQLKRRETYETLKAESVTKIGQKVRQAAETTKLLFDFVVAETGAFYDIMKEYGALRTKEQRSFTLQSDNFKVEIKINNVKKFDERADIAASRLVEFLRDWISSREQGASDPMYQLAMTMIERNKNGDLDYKSISKLYDLESKFNSENYSHIMQLFKEANVIEGTATNFYFYERTELGVWRKIEPSFNRM